MLRVRFLALKIRARIQGLASDDGGQANVSKSGNYDLRLDAARVEESLNWLRLYRAAR
jgi:hypothetical protein